MQFKAQFTVAQPDRLDRFLRALEFPGSEWLSRQAWEKALDSGYVRVNGRVATKGGQAVPAGTVVELALPSLGLNGEGPYTPPLWTSPAGDWAIFNKAPGKPSYPLLPWEGGTFLHEVAAYLAASGILSPTAFAALHPPPILEAGLLQRLDTDTSGILSVAFTPEAKASLRQKFSGEAVKVYWALVKGEGTFIQGPRELWFAGGEGPKVRASSQASGGERVVLGLRVLARNDDTYAVEVRTSQGLRHVVRAGMAALGFPLLGDATYGGDPSVPFHQLHARSIELLGLQLPSAPAPESFLAYARARGLHFSE